MLQDRYPHGFAQPKASTSREPRDAQEVSAAAKGEASYTFMQGDAMAQAIEDGLFLEHCESMNGALYGVTYDAVTVVQSTGKTCVILADSVDAVQAMRAKAFDACYIFLRLSSDAVLSERLKNMSLEEVEVAMRLETYKIEVGRYEATKSESLFDAEIEVDDVDNAYFRLANAISSVAGCVLPKSDVWGFGRCLWDMSERVPGEYPLRICVLGPALSGKSAQCELLSTRFKCPHLAVGELLKAAVESKTELGYRAKRYIDASRNVPDDIIVELLRERLQNSDCRQYGWVLDGFPKTVDQAKRLDELKIVPDKVIFLHVQHADLYKRSEGRRIDPLTGKTYNVDDDMPECDEILARLTIRHDDLQENVAARLAHYEKHEPALKENYHEMSTYIEGGAARRAILGEIVEFITTEDRLSGNMTVASASTLYKPDYIISGVLKYQRQRLLRLQPLGKGLLPVWIDLCELPTYISDFVLLRNQSQAICTQHIDCLTTDSLTGAKMMYVDSPEPVSISVSLTIGPQPRIDDVGIQKSALVITGPSGVGKSTLIELLKQEFPEKFGFSVSHTTRAPRPGEVDGIDYHFTSREVMRDLLSEGYFLESAEVHGNLYGTSYEAVETVAKEGRMCILDIDVQGAAAVRRSGKVDALFVFVEPPSLSILEERLRGRNTDDDETIQRRVRNASEEMKRSMEDGLFDHRVVNNNMLSAYSKLKLIVSENWARVDDPLLCHMSFESFDPKTFATRSMLRFASSSSSSAVLHVPRGKTMVRAKAEPGFIYRSELCCMGSDFVIGDVGDVLAEYADKSFSGFHGAVPSAPSSETLPEAHANLGEWGLLCRKIFHVEKKTHVEAELRLSSDEVQSYAVLAFVNNDSGKEEAFLSGRMSRMELEPNTHGYSIIAYYQGLKTSVDSVSRGEWNLSVISDDALRYVELPTGSQSSAHFHDDYSPNKRAQLCSYRLLGRTHQVLSMHFSISCECRTVFKVVLAKSGVVVKEWEELVNACTFLGIPLDFEADAADGGVSKNSSEYTISVFLSRDSCPFKIQPAGAVNVPLSWRLQLEAPFELEVTKDDTLERQFAATLAAWNDAGAGGPEKRPSTAKAALERFMQEDADRSEPVSSGETDVAGEVARGEEDGDDDSPAPVPAGAADFTATGKLDDMSLLGLNTTRSIAGTDEPLQLNKEASFVVLSSSSSGDENMPSSGTTTETKQLIFDKEQSLYVMREALGSN